MSEPPEDHPTRRYVPIAEQAWNEGWDGQPLDQLRRSAAWTLQQKIRWLEESENVVMRFRKARQKMGLKTMLSNGEIVD